VAAGHAMQYVTRRTGVSRSYIYSSVTSDDVGLLGKRPNDEMRDILMPNELKNAEHLTVRLG